jgi:hypothetical protein
MDVRFDQAGDDRFPLRVEHGGLVADERFDVGGGADANEFAVADGGRLGDAELLVNGENLAVNDDEIRGRLRGPEQAGCREATEE